jgi:hypothetical protein
MTPRGSRVLLLLVPLLASCGAVKFDVEQDLAAQSVPGSVLGGVLPSFLPNPAKLNIDIQAEVAKRGTGPAKAAYLKSLTLAITPHDAPSGNFDFISEVHLSVEAPGVEKKEIARLIAVPKSTVKLTFDIVPDVDLLPYIAAGATISATASGTQPRMDTTFDGHVDVEVRI